MECEMVLWVTLWVFLFFFHCIFLKRNQNKIRKDENNKAQPSPERKKNVLWKHHEIFFFWLRIAKELSSDVNRFWGGDCGGWGESLVLPDKML